MQQNHRCLKELELSNVSAETLWNFSENSISLKQLQVIRFSRLDVAAGVISAAMKKIFSTNNCFKHLSIEYCYTFDDLSLEHCTSEVLFSVNFIETSLREKTLMDFFEKNSRIESIEVGACGETYTNDLLIGIANNCKDLKKLDILQCFHVYDTEGVNQIVQKCKSLRKLICPINFKPSELKETLRCLYNHCENIADFRYRSVPDGAHTEMLFDDVADDKIVIDDVFCDFVRKFKSKLVTLHFSMDGNEFENDIFASKIASTLTSLESLKLDGMFTVDEESLESILKNNYKLKQLHFAVETGLTAKHCDVIQKFGNKLEEINVGCNEEISIECIRYY